MSAKTEKGDKDLDQKLSSGNEVETRMKSANRDFWSRDNLQEVIDQEAFADTAFVAGGALPLCFGESANPIWTKMTASAENGRLTIAGIEFSLDELSQMGGFYRWLAQKGKILRCIDERLDEDVRSDVQVHCECGACNAVKAATNSEDDIEELLALQQGLSDQTKQPLLSGMDNHEAMTIHIGLGPKGVAVRADQRKQQQQDKTLAFNVSLPLELIGQYCLEQIVDRKDLLTTLIKWNVQIARNIIGGHHNVLWELANDTLVLVETGGQDAKPVVGLLNSTLQGVDPNNVTTYSLPN